MGISARSLGDINVQLIMERLGGGGHLNVAGAQLTNCSLQQAKHIIQDTIDERRIFSEKYCSTSAIISHALEAYGST